MNTSIFIGLILLGFGLLVFSIKLMAYNRKKYNFSDSHVGSSSLYLKDFSKNTFRLFILIVLIIIIIILYL